MRNIIEGKVLDEEACYNFMIVCGGNPCKSKFNSVAIVIYVQLTDVKFKNVTNVMPDTLAELELEWVKPTGNRTRKHGRRKIDSPVLGNTTEKEFGDNKFYDHSYGVLRAASLKTVKAIKYKYEIHDVVEFVGVEQTINIPDMG